MDFKFFNPKMPSDKEHTMQIQAPAYDCPTTVDGKICKPSRKNFERQCKQLAEEIQTIHTKLAGNKALLNDLFAKLDKLKEEKNAKFAEKTTVEASVRDMSVNINKLSERLGQLQSKLQYRDLKKLEDAIRALQVHLDSRHFKHCEEKKIVAEIDKLNRSRKVVGEYLGTQSELKALRFNQHSKRTDRDKLIKEIVVVRKQEEEIKAKITSYKTQEAQLRTELATGNDHKQALKEQFTKHQQSYAAQKASTKQAEQDCKQKQQQQLQQNRLSHCIQTCRLGSTTLTSNDKPQTAEMLNCQQLIEFCQRLAKQVGDDRSAQRQKKKKISYTPDLLSKFVSIDVCPPMTIAQAIDSILVLKQKFLDLHRTEELNIMPVMEEVTILASHDDEDIHNPLQLDKEIPMPNEDTCTHLVEDAPEPLLNPTIEDVEAEHPDDQSDKASLGKQLSNTSDEDAIESIAYKLAVLESLCHISDIKTSDTCIA